MKERLELVCPKCGEYMESKLVGLNSGFPKCWYECPKCGEKGPERLDIGQAYYYCKAMIEAKKGEK